MLAGEDEELLGAFRELEAQIKLLLGAPAILAIPHRPPGLEWVDVAAAAELTPQEIDQALLWLTYDDMLKRFGPPDSIVGLSDCKISWRYDLGPRGEIALEFMDGHVVKVWR